MKILEFGKPENRKLLLIHGFQCPWQIFDAYIKHFEKDYHVIVPVLSGHDPESTTEFSSFADEARALEDFMIPRYGSRLFAVYGMSMGGVLAATLWQNARLKFEKMIFDGSPLTSLNGLMKSFMQRFYLNITHKCQQRDAKTLHQATKVIVPEEKLENMLQLLDHMTDTTIVNSLNSIAQFTLKSGMDTTGTEIHFFHGTKVNEVLARKAAKQLREYYPATVVRCFKGKFHCENALFHPMVMIGELNRIFDGKKRPVICRAKKEDLEEILALQYLAYQSEAKLFGTSDIPPLKQTLKEVQAEFNKGLILKAEDEQGNIVGSVRAYQKNGTVYIGKLMVHPQCQRRGLGTRLLQAMENEYPAQRYELFTSTRSIDNIRLYKKLGYTAFREETVSGELSFVYLEKN